MAATTGVHPNLLDARYKEIFYTVWDTAMSDVDLIAREMDFEGPDFRMSQVIASLNTAPTRGENEAITRFNTEDGYDVVIVPSEYALGFAITQRMREDGLHSVTDELPGQLAGIVANTVKRGVFDLLNNAFDSSYALQTNGTELCATSQPIASGLTTGQNRLSADADFSETTAKSMIDLFLQVVNEDGAPMPMSPGRFVTGTSGIFDTLQVTRSATTTEQGTGSSGNGINSVATFGLGAPLASQYIEDTDATFLVAERSASPLMLAWRIRPEFMAANQNKDTLAWNYDVRTRYATLALDWRGVVGTTGA